MANRTYDDPTVSGGQILLNALLAANQLWAQKRDFDSARVEAVRHRAILLNHKRYVERIPVYRHLAKERGLLEVADLDTLVNELMFPSDLFKSYEPRWLDSNDYASMTDWLGSIFFRIPRISLDGVDNITSWRARLRTDSIYVTHSSGTSGRFSFVPRDRFTWAALVSNGRYSSQTVWDRSPEHHTDYDCLILGPRGSGMGIQASATGLAGFAARSHFLFDVEMTADVLRALQDSSPDNESNRTAQRFLEATIHERDHSYAQAFQFLRRARDEGRRVLIFGPPFHVDEACSRILAEEGPIRLEHDSIVITGGGWKGPKKIAHEELLNRIEKALGVPTSHVIDTYSTSECNCVFMNCSQGRYHVPPIIELVALDDYLERIPGNDTFGTIGFLDPFAVSYPGFVITGDEGHLVQDRCACGLTGWSIAGEIRRKPGLEAKGCAGVMASVLA